MDVSVVIIGRNEGERLVRCINSVKAMDYPVDRYEIIYVDSGSTDGSMERAESLGAKSVALDTDKPTAAKGRNMGCRQAKAPFLFFLDGDTIVDPPFISQALEYIKAHDDVAAVSGYRKEIATDASIYNRLLDLDWLHNTGDVQFCGGDTVMRKSVLEEVGGYKEDLIAGEEPELCHRIRAKGHRIFQIDVKMTGHDLNIHAFKGYWMRCYRAGHAYAEVAKLTNGETFGRESKKNHIQMMVYIFGPLMLSIALGIVGLAWLAPLLIPAAVVAVIVRTVTRIRWRKIPSPLVWVFAVHSHFCQLPIWLGQWKYYLKKKDQAGKIIEYK